MAHPVEHIRQPMQRPLLAQPRGQNPLAFRLGLDLERACVALFSRLARAIRVFEKLDLLVGVDVQALRGQAREQRAGEEGACERGVGVDVEVGPVVLVLKVVLDLEGEGVERGGVCGGRGGGGDEGLNGSGLRRDGCDLRHGGDMVVVVVVVVVQRKS